MRRPQPRLVGALAAVTIAGLAACVDIIGLTPPLIVGPDAGSDDARSDALGREDARRDAGGRPCAPLPPSKAAPGRDALLQLTSVATAPDAGSSGVSCSWIDRTEVTVKQYAAWLVDDPTPTWDPTRCAGKGAASPARRTDACPIPSDEVDPFDPYLPMRCVDWCDALAFCSHYGARLCWSGSYDSPKSGDPALPEYDEWGAACSGPADYLFPYGNRFEPSACRIGAYGNCKNGPDAIATCGPLAPGTFPACASPVGAVDMIGNVREWVHLCLLMGATTSCVARGGDWSDPEKTQQAQCLSGSGGVLGTPPSSKSLLRTDRDAYTGFRCCADLTVQEQLQVMDP
jgi:formylglycine-generating enzyme required for sulfatase activity